MGFPGVWKFLCFFDQGVPLVLGFDDGGLERRFCAFCELFRSGSLLSLAEATPGDWPA